MPASFGEGLLICDSARWDSRFEVGQTIVSCRLSLFQSLPRHSHLRQPAWTGFSLSTLARVTDCPIRRRRWPCWLLTSSTS